MFKRIMAFYRYCNRDNLRILSRVFIKPRLVLNPYILFYIGLYYDAMMRRDKEGVELSLSRIGSHKINNFLKAHNSYFYGDYSAAISYLKKSLLAYPHHPESLYLMSKSLLKIGRSTEALQLLFKVLDKSKRKKTWLYLSQAINTNSEFNEFDKRFKEMHLIGSMYDKSLLTYYSDAAIKVGEYQKAIDIWCHATEYVKDNNINETQKKVKFSVGYAELALIHLKDILDKANIPFFLISGTLLGCVRDKSILPYDKDLDVGVWEGEISRDELNRICEISGCFEVASNKDKLIKLKHINGTFIDVFIHYDHGGKVYHQTSKLFWVNETFELKSHYFLGRDFLIPADYNKYLIENYGLSWMTPQPSFDSTFDTPNAIIASNHEIEVYIYRKIFESNLYNKGLEKQYLEYLK